MLLAVKFVIGILDLRDSQKSSHLSRSKVSELSQEQQGVLNVGSGKGAAGLWEAPRLQLSEGALGPLAEPGCLSHF